MRGSGRRGGDARKEQRGRGRRRRRGAPRAPQGTSLGCLGAAKEPTLAPPRRPQGALWQEIFGASWGVQGANLDSAKVPPRGAGARDPWGAWGRQGANLGAAKRPPRSAEEWSLGRLGAAKAPTLAPPLERLGARQGRLGAALRRGGRGGEGYGGAEMGGRNRCGRGTGRSLVLVGGCLGTFHVCSSPACSAELMACTMESVCNSKHGLFIGFPE